jgi:hypothetical protein
MTDDQIDAISADLGKGPDHYAFMREFARAILQAATRDDLGDTDAENAARYLQLRKHAGQIGSMLWRHAPWTHESLEENQARLDLCLDEERVEAIAPKGDGND